MLSLTILADVFTKSNAPWFVAFGFPFFFVGLWLLITFIISRTSGWARIAQSYTADGPLSGTRFGWQSASFRGTNYNNSLNLGVDTEGLYMAPMALFRAFHPPLFIRWMEITAHPVKMWRMFEMIELRFQRTPDIPIRIRATLASQLVVASQGRFQVRYANAAGM